MQIFINQGTNLFCLIIQRLYHIAGVHSLSLTFIWQGEGKATICIFSLMEETKFKGKVSNLLMIDTI